MPYKNKERQREANRLAKQRERGVIPSESKGMTNKSVIPSNVIPKDVIPVLPDEQRINVIKKELNNLALCKEIEAICVYFQHKRPNDTRLARFERALEYNTWLLAHPKPASVHPMSLQPYI